MTRWQTAVICVTMGAEDHALRRGPFACLGSFWGGEAMSTCDPHDCICAHCTHDVPIDAPTCPTCGCTQLPRGA